MKTIFSLEVLQANQGDCLILHYGSESLTKFILIDGGPNGIYKKYLKPRLNAIRKAKVSGNKALDLKRIIVTHADDDHINGILEMTEDMIALNTSGNFPFDVDNIWFNSFDDVIGNSQITAMLTKTVPASQAGATAVVTSTQQGRQISANIKQLCWPFNEPFSSHGSRGFELVRSAIADSVIEEDGLKITVLCPDLTNLKNLQKQWDKDLKKARDSGDTTITVASLINSDKSPFNLSSIACLFEMSGKTMLLGGDAKCEDIYTGLKDADLLKSGKLHVDIFKFPHHGSIANMTEDFLKQITADNYVISANGKNDNPDQETLDLIVKYVKKGTIHFTNHEGDNDLETKLDDFESELKSKCPAVKVNYRAKNKSSILIDLVDPVAY
jgi:beta-lactamase superfamily II metal-dependent hydrolase